MNAPAITTLRSRVKSCLRNILPPPLRRVAGLALGGMRARKLARLGVADAFDHIYRNAYWQQGSSLSGVGSEGEWAHRYAALVATLVSDLDLRTAVDAGCGDFSIGGKIAPLFERYLALDVSAFIIERNRQSFPHLRNVEFRACNLIEEVVPQADVVMIRQVLQHLANDQITAILRNMQRSGCRYLLVAEEQPVAPFQPNRDLQSHSVLTRLGTGSAVDITAPPFSLRARLLDRFHASAGPQQASVLAIHLAELA